MKGMTRGEVRRGLSTAIRSLERITDEVAVMEQPEIRLAGSTEAAEILGISVNTFYQWRHRGKLPKPVAELTCGPIWLAEQIEMLAAERAAS